MDQADQKAKVVVNRFFKSNKEFELSVRLTRISNYQHRYDKLYINIFDKFDKNNAYI